MQKMSSKKRLFARAVAVVLILSIGLFGVTAVNLGRIMIIKGDEYRAKAERNQLQDTEIAAQRGVIYDLNGTVLAQSASVWKVYINPSRIPNDTVKEFICRRISETMEDVSYESIKSKADLSGYSYLTVKSQVEYEEKEKVVALLGESIEYIDKTENEEGKPVNDEKIAYISSAIGIDPDVKRYYPLGTLASAVIGFTGAGDEGRAGLEFKYDSVLAGTPGRIITAKNGRSDLMEDEYETVYDARQGTSLVLTIDTTIQRYLEDGLEDVYEDSQGAGAYGIVMDVKTGAIRALSCVPSYDLNNPYALREEQKADLELKKEESEEAYNTAKNYYYNRNWWNFVVYDSYEPGSVFKTITAAAALEEGAATMQTDYTCLGNIRVATETIKCHNHDGHGYQTLREGLMNSCNPFFITVGQRLGKEKFFEYFEAFGFTEKTGIDLATEITPKPEETYHSLEKMGIVELSSSSFGQSFEVSPLQMITAISAIANGGRLMRPYLVAKTLDSSGNVLSETKPVIRRQVVSKETADLVTGMMEDVVSSGTGKNAYVAGYRVAGKTGTSQKLKEGAGCYVASFGCFAPANDPEIAVLIIVDKPVGQINGGQICTPVAAQVIENTLEYLNVERQYTEEELARLDVATPNLISQKVSQAREQLESEGFSVRVVGDGETVVSQVPAYNATIPQEGIIVLYSDSESDRMTATVPDLSGLSITRATSLALSEGLNISVSGNSALSRSELVSYDQSVSPGEEVDYGTTITVYFKSNTDVSDFAE